MLDHYNSLVSAAVDTDDKQCLASGNRRRFFQHGIPRSGLCQPVDTFADIEFQPNLG